LIAVLKRIKRKIDDSKKMGQNGWFLASRWLMLYMQAAQHFPSRYYDISFLRNAPAIIRGNFLPHPRKRLESKKGCQQQIFKM